MERPGCISGGACGKRPVVVSSVLLIAALQAQSPLALDPPCVEAQGGLSSGGASRQAFGAPVLLAGIQMMVLGAAYALLAIDDSRSPRVQLVVAAGGLVNAVVGGLLLSSGAAMQRRAARAQCYRIRELLTRPAEVEPAPAPPDVPLPQPEDPPARAPIVPR